MEENKYSSGNKWKRAATDGLILASVTVVIILLGNFIKSQFLSTLFWIIKLTGSIYLLYRIMKQYGKETKESTFGYGAIVCLFSSLVCAIFLFFEYTLIAPDAVTEMFDSMFTMMNQSGSMTDQVNDMLLKVEDNFAQYACIGNFFYYAIFGVILSAILNNSTSAPKDIFGTTDTQNNEDE